MNEKILVIDDEVNMRRLLERASRRQGFEVKSAGCPAAALELLKKEKFMLLIVELRIPELETIAFVKKLREAGFRNKCLLLVEYPGVNLRKAREAGMLDLLLKPFDLKEFEAAIKQVFEFSDKGGAAICKETG